MREREKRGMLKLLIAVITELMERLVCGLSWK